MTMRSRLEAAARVAAFAGHGWAVVALEHISEFAKVAEEAWNEAYFLGKLFEFDDCSAGELAAHAVEIAIRETYHRTGQPGPVGWGVESPEVLLDGSIRVTMGAHGQGIVTVNRHDEVLVSVTGAGRSLFVEFAVGTDPVIIHEANAEPRDYARATVLAALALGVDWRDLAIRFPKKLGLANSEEFDRYVRSKDVGELFGAGASDE